MSEAPPPLAYPANARKSSGCARSLVILIFGMLLVFVLAYVTKRESPGAEPAETAGESSGKPSAPEVAAKPLVDIPAIAGKTPAEVESALGEPGSKEDTPQGPKHVYQAALVEVVFIGGKADWITVNPQSPVSFSKQALARLGIAASEPTVSNENVIRWEPCGDYASVSIFPNAGRVDYAYIKVATK